MRDRRNGTVRSEDFAQYVPYTLTKSSDQLGWHGFRVEIVRGHSAGEISLPALDHHLLNFIVAVPTQHEHRWAGASREEIGREGAASLVPAGEESYWRWKYMAEGTPCDLHLHLDPAFVRRVAVNNLDELPRGTEFRGDLCFYNSDLSMISHLLLQAVEQDGSYGALYAESLATSLVSLLLRMQQPARRTPGRTDNSHAMHRVQIVCDYIDANLGSDLHLEHLGELAGLGPDRFGEVFRTALGVSPHRYVLQRRIERAKSHLRGDTAPITKIAVDLGFSDHAHFSATFRKATGLTPSRFRSEALR